MKKWIILFLALVLGSDLIAQNKINLDTLDLGQLNLYKQKALAIRNAGMIITLSGMGMVAAGFIKPKLF